jgi:16S rRNA (cytidine1402-2'-O)-methyltransferase
MCRELTKTYEEIRRGTLGELAQDAASARGEITLVVGGAPAVPLERPTDAALVAAVAALVAAGASKKDAITEVATRYALPRREVYAAAHA